MVQQVGWRLKRGLLMNEDINYSLLPEEAWHLPRHLAVAYKLVVSCVYLFGKCVAGSLVVQYLFALTVPHLNRPLFSSGKWVRMWLGVGLQG